MGNFNAGISKPNLSSFCNVYNLKSLTNKPNSYKNPDNPS